MVATTNEVGNGRHRRASPHCHPQECKITLLRRPRERIPLWTNNTDVTHTLRRVLDYAFAGSGNDQHWYSQSRGNVSLIATYFPHSGYGDNYAEGVGYFARFEREKQEEQNTYCHWRRYQRRVGLKYRSPTRRRPTWRCVGPHGYGEQHYRGQWLRHWS